MVAAIDYALACRTGRSLTRVLSDLNAAHSQGGFDPNAAVRSPGKQDIPKLGQGQGEFCVQTDPPAETWNERVLQLVAHCPKRIICDQNSVLKHLHCVLIIHQVIRAETVPAIDKTPHDKPFLRIYDISAGLLKGSGGNKLKGGSARTHSFGRKYEIPGTFWIFMAC